MIRAAGRAWARAAVAAVYLAVLAAAASHQIHHAGEPRLPRPAADRPLPPGGACPLESALAWKAGELPAPAPAGAPAGTAEAAALRAFFSLALFDPSSFSIRAPPRPAGS
ncbi:MAG: hypothetical protein HYR52_05035 [Candidatus Tectomicrobia bacterium]|nr:hypothetical protein [Candidatus Tectomicrobia bacterium]